MPLVELERVEAHAGHSMVFDIGYIIGFIEGEGGFHLLKTKDSKHPTPQMTVTNTDKSPLLYIQKVLADHGVKSAIYQNDPKPDKRAMWVNTKRKRVYVLRVIYRTNCLALATILDGQLISEGKREQFRIWKEAMVNREHQLKQERADILQRNSEILSQLRLGISISEVARIHNLKESSVYVILFRKGLSIRKLQGGETL